MFRNANACLTPPVAASLVSPRGRRFGALCIQSCREIKMEMVSFFLKAARCPCELPPVKQVCSLVVMIRWFCTMLRLLCICSRDPSQSAWEIEDLEEPRPQERKRDANRKSASLWCTRPCRRHPGANSSISKTCVASSSMAP
jgi:hypothetical protein